MTSITRTPLMLTWSLFLISFSTCLEAARPLWTFTPLTATSISVARNSSATVQYLVTNQSAKSHILAMTPITGVTQVTTGIGICANPFTLPSRGSSCTLSLLVDGNLLTQSITGGPEVCEQRSALQCYKPNATNTLTIQLANEPNLTTSVSTLALAVNNTALNGALTGTPRIITITNNGPIAATQVTYSPSPALPSGTTIAPSSCGTIAPSDTCVLTITPGLNPSAPPGNTNPTPLSLTISGTNTNTVTPTINILTYGSVYQGGYVFSVDDTTPNTGSIGGKVAALTDQTSSPPTPFWSSNGNNAVSYVAILGIDETSTPSQPSPTTPAYPNNTPTYLACNGGRDGACNSENIVMYYTQYRTAGGSPPTPLTQYAAGLCKATISGFTDWYLPAICEEGYDNLSSGNGCGDQSMPGIQNMLSNLYNLNEGGLSGEYWSSTEWQGNPADYAWSQAFDMGNIDQFTFDKSFSTVKVRCVRALTF